MDMVDLPVYIEEEGRLITLNLNERDAERARNDSSFLSELLALHCNDAASTSEPSAAPLMPTMTPTAAENDSKNDSPSLFLWSPACVLLLLSLYEERDHIFGSGTKRHNLLWREIANHMETHGYKVTGAQCQSKLNGLKKTYKKILDHNGTSGNDRKTWPYFDKMNEIFGRTSWVQPQALATEAGPSTETQSPPKKKKMSVLQQLNNEMTERHIQRERRRHEAQEAKNLKVDELMRQRESHHREKMEMLEKILDNFRK